MTDREQKIAEIREKHSTGHYNYSYEVIDAIRFLLDELEQTRKESNMLREELHKFQELAIKAANHHKAERDEARRKAEEAWKEIDSLEEQLLSSQQEIERLREQRDKLIEGLRIATDVLGTVPMNDARLWGVYNKLCDLLKEIGVAVE